ncbi:MAG: MerR family transcriptional regulator [Rhodobacteraceae bacterium]|nr:MerR family transcriptional regulator [Paracoccaceae bacterium]
MNESRKSSAWSPRSADAFRTIGEVAKWLNTQPHVLRFWERKFAQIKPVQRSGGRRYYRPADMQLLGGIKRLLHEDGMTIKGVQRMLRLRGVEYVASLSPRLQAPDLPPDPVVPAACQPPRTSASESQASPPPPAGVLSDLAEVADIGIDLRHYTALQTAMQQLVRWQERRR